MALKKTLMIAGAVSSIGLTGTALGVHAVSAEAKSTTAGQFGMSSLVGKIAERFHLKESDVQEVFDQQKDEMEAEHKAKMEERLNQAIAEGKLTEEQKAKILAKFEEMKANRPKLEEIKNEAPEQRKQMKFEKHDELEQWAKDNGIPEEYVHFGPVVHIERAP